ncbi:MAG: acetyl-CoA hydrolase/transferase family protein [Solirubrobacterales bacterium]
MRVIPNAKKYGSIQEEYQAKLRHPDELAAMINSGDTIMMPGGTTIPHEFNLSLAKRASELKDVTICLGLALKLYDFMQPEYKDNIRIETPFVGPVERMGLEWGTAAYIPTHLNKLGAWMDQKQGRVATFVCTPPDENGWLNRSAFGGLMPKRAIDRSDLVIVEINPKSPWLNGDAFKIHISEIDYLCESNSDPTEIPGIPITDVERQIAHYIADMIPDGSTIQLGLGGLADAIGYFLKDKKDLGVHTEVVQKSFMELMKLGVVNGSKKNFNPGKVMATFCVGDKELWDFVDHNDEFIFTEVEYNNDPRVIGQNDNLVSVNNALILDLTGQVGAESIRHRQYSGTGGQMNFVQGAGLSKGGKSIIALNATWKGKKDKLMSSIVPFMPPGTIVTTPRSEVEYVVTEFGVANLRFKNVSQRVKELINIAHPDFREDLKAQAKRFWID